MGSNQCPLHWKVNSYPLDCLESPDSLFTTLNYNLALEHQRFSDSLDHLYQDQLVKNDSWGDRRRWRRNRMGRPLSTSQIHQKNISTLSKLHKTTSECWQRTSGTQKSRSLSPKTGRKKYKRQKKETKEVGRELHPRKGVLKREEFPNTRKHSHC